MLILIHNIRFTCRSAVSLSRRRSSTVNKARNGSWNNKLENKTTVAATTNIRPLETITPSTETTTAKAENKEKHSERTTTVPLADIGIPVRCITPDHQVLYNETIKPQSPYAYVFVLWNVNPYDPEKKGYRPYIANILIAAKILRSFGSTADIVAVFRLQNNVLDARLLPQEEAMLLAMKVKIRYLGRELLDLDAKAMGGHFRKFYTYSMVEYRRVIALDGDVMPMQSLDYFFYLSDDQSNENALPGGKTVKLKKHIVLSYILEPANDGFIVQTPDIDIYNKAQALIQKHWRWAGARRYDTLNGWGRNFQEHGEFWETNLGRFNTWAFVGAGADQGLRFFLHHYVLRSYTQILAHKIINYGPGPDGNSTIIERQFNTTSRSDSIFANYSTLPFGIFPQSCAKFSGKFLYRNFKPVIPTDRPKWPGCVPPYSDVEHFTGRPKFWVKEGPLKYVRDDMHDSALNVSRPRHVKVLWWQTVVRLMQEDGLDMVHLLMGIRNDTKYWYDSLKLKNSSTSQ